MDGARCEATPSAHGRAACSTAQVLFAANILWVSASVTSAPHPLRV
jgi:hypothetical protein